jgi:4'-phosphopantetheinyl transferase
MDKRDILWRFPPPRIELPNSEIHLWCSPLDMTEEQKEDSYQILSADEQNRASRYLSTEDANKFIRSRMLLRSILSFYLERDPKDLQIVYTAQGKPILSYEDAHDIQFNLSHSADLVVIAVTRDIALGVDIEAMSRPQDDIELAREFFSPQEFNTLQNLSEPHKMEAFLNCWTRKEAYFKATGTGIDESLQEIEVTFMPGEPARYLSISGDSHEATHWYLHSIQPATGYAGAVACRQRGLRLACWRWPENGLSYFPAREKQPSMTCAS